VLTSSNTIAEISAALALAQGQMQPAAKDSINPHFGHSYASLASIWQACRIPLSQNGIGVIQSTSTDGTRALVTTRMVHKSGEWFEDSVSLPVANPTAQGLGSGYSYGRRYSLSGMVGVVVEGDDDDGETAAGRGKDKEAATKIKPPKAKPEPKPEAKPTEEPEFPWSSRQEMQDAYEHLKPFIAESTYNTVLNAHQITIDPVNGQLKCTSRKQLIAAFNTLEQLAMHASEKDRA
jgi:hypothetical protein